MDPIKEALNLCDDDPKIFIHVLRYDEDQHSKLASFYIQDLEESSCCLENKIAEFLWQSKKTYVTIIDESRLPYRTPKRIYERRYFRRRSKGHNGINEYNVTEEIRLEPHDTEEKDCILLREYTWTQKHINTEDHYTLVTLVKDEFFADDLEPSFIYNTSTSYGVNTNYGDDDDVPDMDINTGDLVSKPAAGELARLTYFSEKLFHFQEAPRRENVFHIHPININISYDPPIMWVTPPSVERRALTASLFQMSEKFGDTYETKLLKIASGDKRISDFSLSVSEARDIKTYLRDEQQNKDFNNIPEDAIVISTIGTPGKPQLDDRMKEADDDMFESIEIATGFNVGQSYQKAVPRRNLPDIRFNGTNEKNDSRNGFNRMSSKQKRERMMTLLALAKSEDSDGRDETPSEDGDGNINTRNAIDIHTTNESSSAHDSSDTLNSKGYKKTKRESNKDHHKSNHILGVNKEDGNNMKNGNTDVPLNLSREPGTHVDIDKIISRSKDESRTSADKSISSNDTIIDHHSTETDYDSCPGKTNGTHTLLRLASVTHDENYMSSFGNRDILTKYGFRGNDTFGVTSDFDKQSFRDVIEDKGDADVSIDMNSLCKLSGNIKNKKVITYSVEEVETDEIIKVEDSCMVFSAVEDVIDFPEANSLASIESTGQKKHSYPKRGKIGETVDRIVDTDSPTSEIYKLKLPGNMNENSEETPVFEKKGGVTLMVNGHFETPYLDAEGKFIPEISKSDNEIIYDYSGAEVKINNIRSNNDTFGSTGYTNFPKDHDESSFYGNHIDNKVYKDGAISHIQDVAIKSKSKYTREHSSSADEEIEMLTAKDKSGKSLEDIFSSIDNNIARTKNKIEKTVGRSISSTGSSLDQPDAESECTNWSENANDTDTILKLASAKLDGNYVISSPGSNDKSLKNRRRMNTIDSEANNEPSHNFMVNREKAEILVDGNHGDKSIEIIKYENLVGGNHVNEDEIDEIIIVDDPCIVFSLSDEIVDVSEADSMVSSESTAKKIHACTDISDKNLPTSSEHDTSSEETSGTHTLLKLASENFDDTSAGNNENLLKYEFQWNRDVSESDNELNQNNIRDTHINEASFDINSRKTFTKNIPQHFFTGEPVEEVDIVEKIIVDNSVPDFSAPEEIHGFPKSSIISTLESTVEKKHLHKDNFDQIEGVGSKDSSVDSIAKHFRSADKAKEHHYACDRDEVPPKNKGFDYTTYPDEVDHRYRGKSPVDNHENIGKANTTMEFVVKSRNEKPTEHYVSIKRMENSSPSYGEAVSYGDLRSLPDMRSGSENDDNRKKLYTSSLAFNGATRPSEEVNTDITFERNAVYKDLSCKPHRLQNGLSDDVDHFIVLPERGKDEDGLKEHPSSDDELDGFEWYMKEERSSEDSANDESESLPKSKIRIDIKSKNDAFRQCLEQMSPSDTDNATSDGRSLKTFTPLKNQRRAISESNIRMSRKPANKKKTSKEAHGRSSLSIQHSPIKASTSFLIPNAGNKSKPTEFTFDEILADTSTPSKVNDCRSVLCVNSPSPTKRLSREDVSIGNEYEVEEEELSIYDSPSKVNDCRSVLCVDSPTSLRKQLLHEHTSNGNEFDEEENISIYESDVLNRRSSSKTISLNKLSTKRKSMGSNESLDSYSSGDEETGNALFVGDGYSSSNDDDNQTPSKTRKHRYGRSDSAPMKDVLRAIRRDFEESYIPTSSPTARVYSGEGLSKRYASMDSLASPSRVSDMETELRRRRRMLAGYSYLSVTSIPSEHEIIKSPDSDVRAKEIERELRFIRNERRKLRLEYEKSMHGGQMRHAKSVESIGHVVIPRIFETDI